MKYIVAIVVSLIVPLAVYAHGSGASLERQVGDYLIDIGYEPAEFMAGDRAVFDFALKDANEQSIDFDYLWVRLQGEGHTLLATGIHRADVGATSLLYSIPRDMEGDMSLSVRYQRGEEVLAETDFTIPIAPYEDPRWWWPFAGIGLAAVALGASFTAAVRWKTRRTVSDTL